MKLSNKILIGFFGFLFLYLTAVFAEIRLRGVPNMVNDSNSITETVEISGTSYLVLQDLHHSVNVVGSDQPRVEVRSLSGDVMRKMKHRVSGDTLILSGLKSDDVKAVMITVFVPKSGFKGMRVDSTVAIVKALQQERLHISQRGGQIRMSDHEVGTIYLEARGGSFLSIDGAELDTLLADMERSEVRLGSVRVLHGSMKNNSFLGVSDVDEIRFNKDTTSRLNVYH